MSFSGVEVNHSEQRFEWKTSDLEDNVYRIIGSVSRALEIRAEGKPYLLSDGVTWALNFHRK